MPEGLLRQALRLVREILGPENCCCKTPRDRRECAAGKVTKCTVICRRARALVERHGRAG